MAGPSVARGYFGPATRSVAVLLGYARRRVSALWLRTGDLGCLHEGELYVTGRAKDVIIVRGRKLHAQDIEFTVQRFDPHRIAGVAAFGRDEGEDEGIVVLAELAGRGHAAHTNAASWQRWADDIRAQVYRDHDVALALVAVVAPGALLRTSSGKLMRYRCREAYADDRLAVISIQNLLARRPGSGGDILMGAAEGIERVLIAIVARCLRVAPQEIDPTVPLTRYGSDSLSALELVEAVAVQTRFELSEEAFYDVPHPVARTLSCSCKHLSGRRLPRATHRAYAFRCGPRPDDRSCAIASGPPGCYLLTGANGFLGVHLLRSLLDEGASEVICLVRAADDEAAAQRLALRTRIMGCRRSMRGRASSPRILPRRRSGRPALGLRSACPARRRCPSLCGRS